MSIKKGVAIITIATTGVYFPSFFHLFRGEAYNYFLELKGWGAMPLEPMLFRPLLAGTFNLEYALFGMNPIPWHVLAVAMHLIASLCLFRLLWAIKPGTLAVLITLFFSTMYATVNAILYTVIAPYSLAIALLLTGLYYLYQGVKLDKPPYIYLSILPMLIACLFHEIILFFMVLVGIYLWFEKRRATFPLTYTLATIVFAIAYTAHKLTIPELFTYQFSTIVSLQSVTFGLIKTVLILGTWLALVAMPGAFIAYPTPALQVQPAAFATSMTGQFLILTVIGLVAIFVFGYFIYAKSTGSKLEVSKYFYLLFIAMLAAYLIITSVFRAFTIGIDYILATNINLNMFLAIAIIPAFVWLASRKPSRKHLVYACIALSLIISISGARTFILNYSIMKQEQPVRTYIQQVGAFVKEHNNEPEFSFRVTANPIEPDLHINLHTIDEQRRPKPYNFTALQIIYWEHWNEESPRYTLTYSQDKGLIVQ